MVQVHFRGMLLRILAIASLSLAAPISAEPVATATGIRVIPGTSVPGRQPDGNTVILDAPRGLIVVDTGRHKAQQDAILAYAAARKRPVAAIVNTHWHLDHSGGNAELRAAFPDAPLYASNAIDGALRGFLARSRADAEDFVKSGAASPELAEDIALDIAAMDDAQALRPSVPVLRSKALRIAGKPILVRLAKFAATESDVWLLDPLTGTLVAGDLVVAAAPYFDTACPEGWRKALGQIAAQDFTTLVPGHGEPMTKAQFLLWKRAFDNLLDCAAGNAANAACIAGWKHDAAPFLPTESGRIDGLLGYYLESRLRAPPEERNRYCRPQ